MTSPSEGFKRVGVALRAERGGRARERIATESGVGARTIQDYEAGKEYDNGFPGQMIQLAKYYRWTPGSLQAVYDGGEPRYRPSDDAPEPPRPMDPAVKAEWRRQVEASPMSAAAKRENLAFIDSIPDAD